MNLGPSLSVDQLTETQFPFQNFNFTGNINSHVQMNIFPSVNPMDEEDFRKDGLPNLQQQMALDLMKQISQGKQMCF